MAAKKSGHGGKRLRGKVPSSLTKRFKCAMLGHAGSGKTTAAIQFPSPYLIDTEKGAENSQYVDLLADSGGSYLFTADLDEIITEVRTLIEVKHGYRTLIIDPLTVPYMNACDAEAMLLATSSDKTGTEFGRHKARPDRKMRHLFSLLTKLDMNVIITTHEKSKWERTGGELKEVGKTYDCYSKMDYLLDLLLEVSRTGKKFNARVVKTRLDGFKLNDIFEFSYHSVADRYGRELLEKDAVPRALISADDMQRMDGMLDRLRGAIGVDDVKTLVGKWVSAAGIRELNELDKDQGQKCLAVLDTKLKAVAAEQEAIAT